MQAAEEVELVSGPIPLGATRPPMVPFVGLPFSAAVPLILLGAEIAMLLTGWRGLLVGGLVMAVIGIPLRVWVSYDWYAIEILAMWAKTAGPALDSADWGGSTMSPWPTHPHHQKQPQGMMHNA